MIKAVLFDLDGTLVNTNKLIIESFKYTYSKALNISVDEKEIVESFGEPLMVTLAKYDKENAENLCNTYFEFNEKMHDKLAEDFEGSIDTLLALKKLGVKTGVVTSKRRAMAEKGLKLFGTFDKMDVIITPEDTKLHKPHPDPVLKACEELGVTPLEVIMVGDSSFDIQCGKNAGCLTCAVNYTALPIESIKKFNPDYFIDSLYDLVNIVNDINLNEKGLSQNNNNKLIG